MKTAALLLFSMAAISCAQDRKVEPRPPEARQEKKRLESVTWDLKAHKLIWVVQRGSEKGGEFVPNASDRYEISPDDAVMAVSGEKRGFTQEEASSLHKLLDTLSLYCAESVIWWDQGEGVPVDGSTPPRKNSPKVPDPGPNKQRVEHAPASPAPPPDLLVAQSRVR